MVRLHLERYATKRAHKLHPRAAGPFRVHCVINPNAYDIAIPPDWGIPSTFNVCDLVSYQGPLEVPSESGLPPDSTEPSRFAPEENDRSHSTASDVMANDPESGVVQGDSSGSQWENDAAEERVGRRQCPAKPTARPSEFYYF